MKTIKLLSAFLVLIYIGGCNQERTINPLDSYIQSAQVDICDIVIQIGSNLDPAQNASYIIYEQESRTGELNCNQPGILKLTGSELNHRIMISRLAFALNNQNQIDFIAARFFDLGLSGEDDLYFFRNDDEEFNSTEIEQYKNRGEAFNNDPEILIYEIQNEHGTPDSIKPTTWRSDAGEVSIVNEGIGDNYTFSVELYQ